MTNPTPDDFEILQGEGFVMLSAPHGVELMRSGKVKPAEAQTSDLAHDLHRALCCPAIIKTRSGGGDPNHDERSPYRDALVKYVNTNQVKAVFDLHQLSSEREAAFILGTADGRNLRDDITLPTLRGCLEDLGLGAVLVDEVFKASGKNTVAAYTSNKSDVSCIQVEINSKYLCKEYSEYAYDRIRDALQECIVMLNSSFADHVYDGSSVLVRIVDESLPVQDGCLYSVGVSPAFYRENYATPFQLVCPALDTSMDISILPWGTLADDEIAVTKHVQRTLKLAGRADREVFMQKAPYMRFDKIRVQSIDKVSSEDVVISARAIGESSTRELFESASLFGIKDVITNQSFIVKANHLVIDDSLDTGVIKLNRRQRILLGERLPCRLEGELRQRVVAYIAAEAQNAEASSGLGTGSDETQDVRAAERRCVDQEERADQVECADQVERTFCGLAILEKAYPAHEPIRQDGLSHPEEVYLRGVFERCFPPSVVIKPIISGKKKRNIFKRIGRWIANLYVGKSTLSLMCRRPYVNDENDRVVRMTKDNMAHLGVEEMDNIIVSYKDKECICQVFPIEDDNKLRANNLYTPVDMTIGIPLPIRTELGITDLDSTVKVDRDTAFIMKKCANEQVIPVLLALFSMNFLQDYPLYVPIVIFLVIAPIIIYVNLSSKRNSRGKY